MLTARAYRALRLAQPSRSRVCHQPFVGKTATSARTMYCPSRTTTPVCAKTSSPSTPRRPRGNPRPEPGPPGNREPAPPCPRLILERGLVPGAQWQPGLPVQRRHLHHPNARAVPASTTGPATLRRTPGRSPAGDNQRRLIPHQNAETTRTPRNDRTRPPKDRIRRNQTHAGNHPQGENRPVHRESPPGTDATHPIKRQRQRPMRL